MAEDKPNEPNRFENLLRAMGQACAQATNPEKAAEVTAETIAQCSKFNPEVQLWVLCQRLPRTDEMETVPERTIWQLASIHARHEIFKQRSNIYTYTAHAYASCLMLQLVGPTKAFSKESIAFRKACLGEKQANPPAKRNILDNKDFKDGHLNRVVEAFRARFLTFDLHSASFQFDETSATISEAIQAFEQIAIQHGVKDGLAKKISALIEKHLIAKAHEVFQRAKTAILERPKYSKILSSQYAALTTPLPPNCYSMSLFTPNSTEGTRFRC